MKLIDPTDDELNRAFAEHVAGMTQCESLVDVDEKRWCGKPPTFTEYADAVLPWLEKWDCRTLSAWRGTEWTCFVCTEEESFPEWEGVVGFDGSAANPAKAVVICLLRANGVEIEFTK